MGVRLGKLHICLFLDALHTVSCRLRAAALIFPRLFFRGSYSKAAFIRRRLLKYFTEFYLIFQETNVFRNILISAYSLITVTDPRVGIILVEEPEEKFDNDLILDDIDDENLDLDNIFVVEWLCNTFVYLCFESLLFSV